MNPYRENAFVGLEPRPRWSTPFSRLRARVVRWWCRNVRSCSFGADISCRHYGARCKRHVRPCPSCHEFRAMVDELRGTRLDVDRSAPRATVAALGSLGFDVEARVDHEVREDVYRVRVRGLGGENFELRMRARATAQEIAEKVGALVDRRAMLRRG